MGQRRVRPGESRATRHPACRSCSGWTRPATCRRHRILPEPLVVRLDSLVGAVAAVAAAAEAENAGEMPERFLDEIM